MEPIILDCNYVQNVSIDGSELWGVPGMIPLIPYGKPIGVCESDPSEMSSKIYECEANGNSVSLKYFRDNTNCEGSNFISFSGDAINYSSFNCDAPSNCPYVQYTEHLQCNGNMNDARVYTILTDVCYYGEKYTCTNQSVSHHDYSNKQCSDSAFIDTFVEGCNSEYGMFYSDIKCSDGVLDFTTTSGTTDTTGVISSTQLQIDTTDTTDTTMEPIILDCNYVQNVSIDMSEFGGPGMVQMITWGTPIGVCTSNPSEMMSTIYECEANGNSVSLKWFIGNSNCEGSNFTSFSGDTISYSSFNCDAPSNCPYVQYTKYKIQDMSNPCNVDMNYTFDVTILTDVCYESYYNSKIFRKSTCANESISHHLYANQQCSDYYGFETHEEGCNDYEKGWFYSEIKCYDGVSDFINTSGTTDTTGVISSTQLQIDTTDTTDTTTMEPIILDCNYVQNVSIDVSEFGGPGIVQMITFGSPGTPIGVCTSDSSEMSSKIYECEANGNSVSLKYFRDNTNCEGSNFISFSGDAI
eukprot:365575_1